jgi:hypothetical protein
MVYSRNWAFTFAGDAEQAIILNKRKESDNILDSITFLQLSNDKCLVVFKNQMRKSAVRRIFSITDAELVSSAKEFRDSMGEVTFSYGKILNKHEKKLANKSTSYGKTVNDFAKTALIPEDDPKFDAVYNIVASADTREVDVKNHLKTASSCRIYINAEHA